MTEAYRLETKVNSSRELQLQNFDGNLSPKGLEEAATRILRMAGFNKYGRRDADVHQSSFEFVMQTGAYGRNSERRKR